MLTIAIFSAVALFLAWFFWPGPKCPKCGSTHSLKSTAISHWCHDCGHVFDPITKQPRLW